MSYCQSTEFFTLIRYYDITLKTASQVLFGAVKTQPDTCVSKLYRVLIDDFVSESRLPADLPAYRRIKMGLIAFDIDDPEIPGIITIHLAGHGRIA